MRRLPPAARRTEPPRRPAQSGARRGSSPSRSRPAAARAARRGRCAGRSRRAAAPASRGGGRASLSGPCLFPSPKRRAWIDRDRTSGCRGAPSGASAALAGGDNAAMASRDFSRRSAAAAMAAGALVPRWGFAQTPPAPADVPPDGGAFLETAFDSARRVTVPVTLNGFGPFEFVVDTGANRSVVSLEIAQRLRLPSAGTAPVHGIVSAEAAPLAKVKHLRVGEVLASRLSLPVVPAARLGA